MSDLNTSTNGNGTSWFVVPIPLITGEILLHMTDLDKPSDEPLLPKRNKVTGLRCQKGLNLYAWENERSESVVPFRERFCRQPWICISALFEHSEHINELLQQSKSACDARPLSWMEGY